MSTTARRAAPPRRTIRPDRGRALAGAAGQDASPDAGQDKLQALHDTLTAAVASLADGAAWQQMLRTAALFHHYSPHNVLLITAQCPHAQAVAGYQTWKQLDRQVRKGERGIAILAPVVRRGSREALTAPRPEGDGPTRTSSDPVRRADPAGTDTSAQLKRLAGFRVVHVFDISQTDGADLPTAPRPDLLEGQAPPNLVEGLTRQVEMAGFRVAHSDFTTEHPGLAGANGVTDFLARTVQIRPGLSDAQACKTLAHELGHVLLHEPLTRPAAVTRDVGEVEAESVAYIVAAAHGLDTARYTVPYVAGWAAGDVSILRGTAERVLDTARRVLAETPPAAAHTLPDSIRQAVLTRDVAPAPAVEPSVRQLMTVVPVGTTRDVLRDPAGHLEPTTGAELPALDAAEACSEPDLPTQGGLW